MKGIFKNFFHFFCGGSEKMRWREQNVRNTQTNVRQSVGQNQKPAAEQPKVTPAARQQAQGDVNAHHAAAGDHRPDEQRHSGHRPEQHVQRAAQTGQGNAHPQHPEQVVDHAQQPAQRQGTGQGQGLGGDVHPHLSAGAGPAGRPGRWVPRRSGSRWCPPPSGRRRPD